MNWKRITTHPDYAVSDCGQVMKIESGRKLTPGADRKGYLSVGLPVNGATRRVSVHRLVAAAFIENPLGKPCVNHIDGNKANNAVSNLEWVTHSENWAHAIRTGLSNPRTRCKLGARELSEIKDLYSRGVRNRDLAAKYGVGRRCIYRLLTGRTYANHPPVAKLKTARAQVLKSAELAHDAGELATFQKP